ncbi:MAG: hypothetical protein DI536_07735 [Archangium gephyra]|uniref:Uncharacterized protein n=1 Tax=Archangium gephyra TaxID=48 RepID=A0A2W5TQM0_9BACT|nr:MAG: hypothetical protein DI536_07735 [Archangium gephyra]
MFAVIVAAVTASTSISVAIDPDVSCVTVSSLGERLSRSGISIRQGASTLVAIHQRPTELIVEARNGATRFRRELKRANTCGAVERAVALLVSSWLRQLPQAERASVKSEAAPPIRRAEPAPPPVATRQPQPEPPPVTPETPEPEPPPVTPETPEPEPPPVVVAAPIETVVAADEPEAALGNAAARPTVDLAMLGGGTIGTTPDVAGAGTLAATIGFGRLGFGADLGFESIRAVDIAPARIETLSKWATLNGRVAFQPAQRLSLDLTVGLRVWHIGAVALNVENPTPASLWGIGGALSAGATLRIVSSISAELRVFTSLRHRHETFMLDNAGTVMTLQTLQGGVLLGISWRAVGS